MGGIQQLCLNRCRRSERKNVPWTSSVDGGEKRLNRWRIERRWHDRFPGDIDVSVGKRLRWRGEKQCSAMRKSRRGEERNRRSKGSTPPAGGEGGRLGQGYAGGRWVSAPSSFAHFAPRLGIFPMTTSSTASALILAIILLLVAPLSPGNYASTGEGEGDACGERELQAYDLLETSQILRHQARVLFFLLVLCFARQWRRPSFLLISGQRSLGTGEWQLVWVIDQCHCSEVRDDSNLVEVDVGGELLTKSSNLFDDGLLSHPQQRRKIAFLD
ncbi:hypothetical protein ZIOFF_023578 [Zingiber officinale]|uniref:Uncharacterized protein n=1 Tax=Zingiber officinale TaxID=94328 RepID=A0A8J5GSS6_ZINOF|nr:hypothetical protein ZIOFF_023578 [Zingiber officinale]